MRLSAALVAIVLLALPYSMVAQRGGGGRRGGGGGSHPSGGADPNTMKDFNLAVAVQATDEQRADFLSFGKSTETARKRASDLASNPANSADKSQISAL